MPVVALSACALLLGAHADHVRVTSATQVEPGTTVATDGAYRAVPVETALCRVEGTIEGDIGFELWLPADWNGRLLGAGVGGDAGVYNLADVSRRANEGFAAVTTDSGHKRTNARWMADPKARQDYEHRAVHLTAQAAKALSARFYGRAVERSYFLGCSGGGRQALKEMQLYPLDYDGVVAGAPGPYMPLQSVRMMWFSLLQQRDPAGALTDADWALYESRAVRSCDKLDGVEDGILENPMRCRFDIATLACQAGQSANCLAPAKVAMLERIVSPMPDEAGRAMDRGLLPGVRTRPGPPSPLLRAMWADGVYDDPLWNADSFERTRDLAAANHTMPELRADRVDITPFLSGGRKALLYQGWADPSTNADPTIDYYTRLAAANGGPEALARSVRLFMVPGMYHCGGGPGADTFGGSGRQNAPGDPERDILWALIRWVEDGQAPDRIVATKFDADTPLFTRALCPFPQAARFDGRGPADSSASYSCEHDPVLAATFDRAPVSSEGSVQ
ncbi:MAG TPA: tannase/feruloyl esterase family alpha/beta hydrolase [Croceibacterium sp.]|nr:tannase/feruloyl esterase family alpha/beta hydrolase [Croceibacterium sp.]